MSKARRFLSEQEILTEIDRLKDEIPALHQRAEIMDKECKEYFLKHLEGVNHLEVPEPVVLEYRKLSRAAKRAASAPSRQEKKLRKLAEALSEFRTQRMPFLTDETVEVK